jgi:chemotaxis protein CheZ
MVKMMSDTASDKSGDNDELEALFNSIVGQSDNNAETTVEAKQSEEEMMAAMMGETASAAPSKQGTAEESAASAAGSDRGQAIFTSLGHLTRQLHETLRDLGYDKSMERLATELPDARDRLNYVAKMTEQAAERVLNATDSAQPIQVKLSKDAGQLQASWQDLLQRPRTPTEGGDQLKLLVQQTQVFLGRVAVDSDQTNKYLMDIVMAQDFQDLTGQVIKKIITAASDLESRLVEILVQYTPGEKREEVDLLNGPQIKTEGRTDVVADQQQVDDLLASLGF